MQSTIVLRSRKSYRLALAPICRLSRPGGINAISTNAQPCTDLFELLDRSRMKSAHPIGSHSDLEAAALRCSIHDVLNDPPGAFIVRGIGIVRETTRERIDDHPWNISIRLIAGH